MLLNFNMDSSRRLRSAVVALSASLLTLLVACGGGGSDAGTPPFGNGGNGGVATAADLTLVLSSTELGNSGSETVLATATAVDSNRNTVAGIPVTISVDQDATIATSGALTKANGTVTGQIGIGAVSSNRTVTVRASSGNLVRTATVRVVGTRLTATPLPAVIAPSSPGKVQFKVVNANAIAMAGIDITVSGADGTESKGSTSVNGEYEYSYTSPAAAGTVNIRASAAGVEVTQTVVVQSGTGAIPVVPVGSVRSASVRANPSVVSVNALGSSVNRAEIRALFLGNSNAPIKNIRVRFDLDGDAASIGGTFSTDPNVVYSDDNGVATSAYIPGTRFSPTDKVTVRACWGYTDFNAGVCPNEVKTTLTVISDALSVAIGTNNVIKEGIDGLTYIKDFVVQVNDSSGLAKQDVLVSPLLDLTHFRKGEWVLGADAWEKNTLATCPNEDLNRNGVAEVYPDGGGAEDANGTYNNPAGRPALDPPKAAVTVSFVGSARTSSVGQVVVRMEYPQSYGSWIDFNLIVAAAGVAGTEGRANYTGILPVAAVDVTTANVEPPFRESPFGLLASPVTPVTMPNETTPTLLCTSKD